MVARVNPQPEDRSGILIVRAWLEGRGPAIRVRITSVRDVAGGEHAVAHAATVEEATQVVSLWLRDFEGGDPPVTPE